MLPIGIVRVFFVIGFVINLCGANGGENRKYCGTALITQLQDLCSGRFNSRFKKIGNYKKTHHIYFIMNC